MTASRRSTTHTGELIATLQGHRKQVSAAVFSPDCKRIVTAGDDGTAPVWSAATGDQLLVLGDHRESVSAAVFSPNGERVVTFSWTAQSGRGYGTLPLAMSCYIGMG